MYKNKVCRELWFSNTKQDKTSHRTDEHCRTENEFQQTFELLSWMFSFEESMNVSYTLRTCALSKPSYIRTEDRSKRVFSVTSTTQKHVYHDWGGTADEIYPDKRGTSCFTEAWPRYFRNGWICSVNAGDYAIVLAPCRRRNAQKHHRSCVACVYSRGPRLLYNSQGLILLRSLFQVG